MIKSTKSTAINENEFYLENGKEKRFPFETFNEKIKLQVYEILRVIDGVPLFVEDHYLRFLSSCTKLNLSDTISTEQFSMQIVHLIHLNRVENGNLKIEVLVGESGGQTIRMYCIPSKYPSVDQYSSGVPVGLLHAVRSNPQIKVAHLPVRELADRVIRENNWYEALLVDREGFITEGSRSNVFFLRDDVFYTAPAEKVLIGITRLKIMECIRNFGKECREVEIRTAELNAFDAAFLSGTSPKILPVSSVEEIPYNVNHPILRQLMQKFDAFIGDYICQRKAN